MSKIYAAFSHLRLENESYDFGHGVSLRKIYAHSMTHNLVAVNKPETPQSHHPGPWFPVSGTGFDVEAELVIPEAQSLPDALTQEDVIWWVAVLTRFTHNPLITVPLISNASFSDLKSSDPSLVRIRQHEPTNRLIAFREDRSTRLHRDLDWVASKWFATATKLGRNTAFRLALESLDSSSLQNNSAAVLAAWSCLEELFMPSRGEIRFKLATFISSYLRPYGPERLALFKLIQSLYDKRSDAAHTITKSIETDAVIGSIVVARNAVMKMIDEGRIPTPDELKNAAFAANDGF